MFEQKVFPDVDFIPKEKIEQAESSVCKIETWRANGTKSSEGSGFIAKLGSNKPFLLTNNHVIPDKETAKRATILARFDGVQGDIIKLNPDEWFKTNKDLDYTAVRVVKVPIRVTSIDLDTAVKPTIFPFSTTIFQCPNGSRVVSSNGITWKSEQNNFILYDNNTLPGSSGGLVLDSRRWAVVALHHQAVTTFNRGVLITGIVDDIIVDNIIVDDIVSYSPVPVPQPNDKIVPKEHLRLLPIGILRELHKRETGNDGTMSHIVNCLAQRHLTYQQLRRDDLRVICRCLKLNPDGRKDDMIKLILNAQKLEPDPPKPDSPKRIFPEPDPVFPEAVLSQMSREELRVICRKRQLPSGGEKDRLISEILNSQKLAKRPRLD